MNQTKKVRCREGIGGQGMYLRDKMGRDGKLYDIHCSSHCHIDELCPYDKGSCRDNGCWSLQTKDKPCMDIMYKVSKKGIRYKI